VHIFDVQTERIRINNDILILQNESRNTERIIKGAETMQNINLEGDITTIFNTLNVTHITGVKYRRCYK
jgi:hypothetical protein